MKKSPKEKGFTLIEIVMVIVILGIIATIAAPLILNSARLANLQHDFANTTTQGQNAATQITHDIRNIKSISTMDADELSFIDNNDETVTYSMNDGNLEQGSNILAQNVSGLAFTYLNSSLSTTTDTSSVKYISFSFTITNNSESQTFANSIYLRNT